MSKTTIFISFFFLVQFVNQLGTKLIFLARDSQITCLIMEEGKFIYIPKLSITTKKRIIISFLREDNNLIKSMDRSICERNKVERRFIYTSSRSISELLKFNYLAGDVL